MYLQLHMGEGAGPLLGFLIEFYPEEQIMDIVNPDKLRLVPGQSIEAVYAVDAAGAKEVGFFVRSASGIMRANGDPGIRLRAGLIRYNDVLLVLTMLKLDEPEEEFFDIWWNYYSKNGREHFKRIAEQERLTVHFYTANGKGFSINTENGFRKFFQPLPSLMVKSVPWNDIEFDRAVRGFCAQSYPPENLWDIIEVHPEEHEPVADKVDGIEAYNGVIPSELTRFYMYVAGQGHCIRIIPSTLEKDALVGDPEEFLYPAPVKTVLRCGVRWVKECPVAPIPFIPGHGLAVPPDDAEF
jgi:hypothetical protein